MNWEDLRLEWGLLFASAECALLLMRKYSARYTILVMEVIVYANLIMTPEALKPEKLAITPLSNRLVTSDT